MAERLLLCAAAALAALAVPAARAARFSPLPGVETLVPLPQSLEYADTNDLLTVSPSALSFGGCTPYPEVIQAAVERFRAQVFWNGQGGLSTGTLSEVSICVEDQVSPLSLGVDESYSVSVNDQTGVATVQAVTVWGALHALQTLGQLIVYEDGLSTPAYVLRGVPLAISDQPRYPWRGLLVDTARHYLPITTLMRQIDAMAAAKLNVLHWHVVDAESFPFESASFPLLSSAGAYHPSAVFTASQVTQVVSYAQARGIRVMPEFDVPGHSASWSDGYPGVVTNCPDLAANINNLNLNPANNQTLPLLRGVISDAAAAFPDDYLHVGGDEVVTDCWNQDPMVRAWMAQNHLDANGVYNYFVNQTYAAVSSAGRNAVMWQDVIDAGLVVPPSTLIEVWNGDDLPSVLSKGFYAITASGYYLDRQVPNPPFTTYEFLDTWVGMYANDPASGLNPEQASRVLGGEAAMWGEQVSDLSIDTRVWPRAAAVAERLWSDASVNNSDLARPRLAAHACRLMRLGVRSSPVMPDFCLLPQ